MLKRPVFTGRSCLGTRSTSPNSCRWGAVTDARRVLGARRATRKFVGRLYEAVRRGAFPCRRVGRHIRFTKAMLDEWLAEQPRN